jgi:hypothetical protein
METLPAYVSIVFILTTFAAIGFLLQATKAVGLTKLPSRILIFVLPLWIMFQGVLAVGGFYLKVDAMPPRIALFGVWPAVLFIACYFIFFRRSFIERLPLKILTLVHIVRIPVELTLLWLYFGGQVPRMMTFEGLNFDILSGVIAIGAFALGFRGNRPVRSVLIAFNVIGLLLLVNIVSIAILSLPTPIQRLNFDQPNWAVLYFPYVWLPSIVVPIVLFSHLASLWQLLITRHRTETLNSANS